ncbi:sensor histidine kinase [Thermoactinomyces mirandus]|uniref:histidine kinase n=1 Tax=Thermoactinomyces mirandus TaxID=2756294 RepID=A0A7W2AS76_9BACL|nr:ATP-binding protein [Thermoactinomyces mirandus]MBA4603308.1 HAMP domain-containing protein [Thermoactinomyces mirandus]
MKKFKGLRMRLALACIGIASGTVFIASLFFILATDYHLTLYHKQLPGIDPRAAHLDYHFQQAMIQSTLLTAFGAMVLAVLVSLYVTKRITAPLIEMRQVAEQITKGCLKTRVSVQGEDELSDLGQALNHLTEELEKQESLRKNLTSDIAHELRTPLATLRSHLAAFQDGIWIPTPERLHSCYEEIERLTHLVKDLEQLTHVESPGFTLNRKEEDLAEIVRQGVRTIQAAYVQKGIDLEVKVDDAVRVNVDRKRVMQILMNLLSNSLKFTNSGGKVAVEVKEETTGGMLVVSDNGAGIPLSDLPKVFERFYRVDKSRSRDLGGSGIGLTIVKKLVEAHEGKLWIESREGEGTTVSDFSLFTRKSIKRKNYDAD